LGLALLRGSSRRTAPRGCDNRAVPSAVATRELTVCNGDVSLGGALWLPPEPRGVAVLMHPGSGPTDRDNDVFFPPIRQHLLESGIAVASFDKRGVGHSSGRWQDAGIEEQASDAITCLEALRAHASLRGPVGLYGHSQGGWVVIEAASRCPDAAFVVTSSGPGVTPAEQERFATRRYMTKAGLPESDVVEVGRYYDRVISLLRSGVSLAGARARLEQDGFPEAFEKLSLPVLLDDDAEWQLLAALLDYDPRPALEGIEVPLLALFGGDDPLVPVEASVAVYRDAVPPDRLHVEVFAGAGHRLDIGDPPVLADGYLEVLASFIVRATATV
jgi:pimeloyl-ACP methyl ester carboxylesterase